MFDKHINRISIELNKVNLTNKTWYDKVEDGTIAL